MNTIAASYQISPKTLALLPAKQIAYDTIAIEQNATKHIRMTPLQIIQAACYNNWTTYEGRRQAVHHHTNFKQKVPIPIDIQKGIYFFPTQSPNNIHTIWIAYQHIAHLTKATHTNHTIIHFTNGQTLELDISMHILQKQIERTFQCKWKIEKMNTVFS